MKRYKILNISFLLTLLVTIVSYTPLHAQTTSIKGMLTWQAQSFYPSDYLAKAPATKNSRIVLGLIATENGSLINLSNYTIIWYIDGKFSRRGEGLTETSFRAGKSVGDYHFVRVVATSGNKKFESSVQVPIESYSIVIEAPFINNIIDGTKPVTLRAVPYFFNIASLGELMFAWTVRGERNDPGFDNELTISFTNPPAPGTRIDASVTAHNQSRVLEFATDNIVLTAL